MSALARCSIRALLLGMTILLFIAVMAISYLQAEHTRKTIRAVVTGDLHHDVTLIKYEQRALIDRARELVLHAMAAVPPSVSPEQCHRWLADQLLRNRGINNIGFASRTGDVRCQAAKIPFQSIGDREYFKRALLTDDFVLSGVITSRGTGKRVITFAKAMRDARGEVVAVYFAGLDLEWIAAALSDSEHPAGTRLTIIDAAGNVVARYPDAENLVGHNVGGMPLAQIILARGDGVAEVDGLDGTRLAAAFTPLLENIHGKLYIAMGVPTDVIDARARQPFWFSLAAASLLFLPIMALIYWGGEHFFVRRIKALDSAVRRFSEGDHTARSGLQYSPDEIGRLALSFDNTAQVLGDRKQELSRVTRTLRVLSSGNRAMLQAASEKALVEEMCRIVVETGGYRIACIGYLDDRVEETLRLAAFAGPDLAFRGQWQALWNENHPEGITRLALREGRPLTTRYIAAQRNVPWRLAVAERFGYSSILAIPLQSNDVTLGALVICAEEPEAFNDEEVEMLSEFAGDLAYGISAHRQRAVAARLETSLHTIKEQLGAIAEASLDVLLILKCMRDGEGHVKEFEMVHVNRRAEEVLGVTRNMLIGRRLTEDFTYSSAAMFKEYVCVYESQQAKEVEFQTDALSNATHWLRQQIVPMQDGVAVFSRDITVEKEATQRILQSEASLHLALGAGRMGAWTWDIASDSLLLTDGAAALVGLRGAETRTSVSSMVARVEPTDRPALEAAIQALRRKGGHVKAQFRVPWPDGMIRWLEIHSEGITAGGGAVNRAVGVVMDVTDHKENVRALGKANRKLTMLSGINERLVRCQHEDELLQAVCEVLAGDQAARLVGIGYTQHDAAKTIRPVAMAGAEGRDIEDLANTWDDNAEGQRPISRAIRTGLSHVENDIPSAKAFARWHETAGKRQFLSNLAIPLTVDGKIIGALSAYSRERDAFDTEEVSLFEEVAEAINYGLAHLRTVAERDKIAYQHEHHAEILSRALEQTIQAVSATIEMRDPYTSGHQRRVAQLAAAIGQEMGLPGDRVEGLRLAAMVHDVGKITIPAEILSKPKQLSEVERMLVRGHAEAGHDILKDVAFPWPIAQIVLQHHERVDGSGYPYGLKGDELLLESRILAVADTVEAMASHRPYRASLGIEAALKEIADRQGKTLDPHAVRCCLTLFTEKRFSFAS